MAFDLLFNVMDRQAQVAIGEPGFDVVGRWAPGAPAALVLDGRLAYLGHGARLAAAAAARRGRRAAAPPARQPSCRMSDSRIPGSSS